MWTRIAQKYNCVYVNEPLINYHVHGSECISHNYTSQIQGHERYNEKYWEYISKNKDILWYRLMLISLIYANGKSFKNAMVNWFKVIKVKPLSFIDNLAVLLKILKRIIKK